MFDLLPVNIAAALEAVEWSHIESATIDPQQITALKAKPATNGKVTKYQAGVKVSRAHWYWSRKLYETQQDAEAAARVKAAELKETKGK